LLRKPAERCQAYPRLLQDVLDHTDDGHPDAAALAVAVSMAEDASEAVNKNLRSLDSALKLSELEQNADGVGKLVEQGRELVWDGVVLVQTGKEKGQERAVYVLDTCMLIVSAPKAKQRQKLKARIPLDQLAVHDVQSTGGFSHRIELKNRETNQLSRVTCSTGRLKKTLLESLSDAAATLARRNSSAIGPAAVGKAPDKSLSKRISHMVKGAPAHERSGSAPPGAVVAKGGKSTSPQVSPRQMAKRSGSSGSAAAAAAGRRSPAVARMNVPRGLQARGVSPSPLLGGRPTPAPGGHRRLRSATAAGTSEAGSAAAAENALSPRTRIAQAAAAADEVASAEAARAAKAAAKAAKAAEAAEKARAEQAAREEEAREQAIAEAAEAAAEAGVAPPPPPAEDEEESGGSRVCSGSRVGGEEEKEKGSLLAKLKKRALNTSKGCPLDDSEEDVETYMAGAAPSLPPGIAEQKFSSRVSYGSIQRPKTTTSTKTKRNRSRRGPRPVVHAAAAAAAAAEGGEGSARQA